MNISSTGVSKVLPWGVAAALVCLLRAAGAAPAVENNCWTNHAGHALRATPQAINGGTVTFTQGSKGRTVKHPISIFMPSEQERLRLALNDATLPDGLQDAGEFAARSLKRSRLLLDNGGCSKEDYEKTLADTMAAFRAQAAAFVRQKKLLPERLELIVRVMVEESRKDKPKPAAE